MEVKRSQYRRIDRRISQWCSGTHADVGRCDDACTGFWDVCRRSLGQSDGLEGLPCCERRCLCANVDREHGLRLWRRPLTSAERDKLLLGFNELTAESSRSIGLSYVLERMLLAKDFLFRSELGVSEGGSTTLFRLTPYEVAAFLSFFLWQSVPDTVLLEAAKTDQLKTLAQVSQQIERMTQDPRGKRGLMAFFYDWLHLHLIQDVNKDTKMFPQATAALRGKLEASARMFLEAMIEQKASLADILLSSDTFADTSISSVYTDIPAQSATLQRVQTDRSKRLGILLSPAFTFAHAGSSSTGFVHRGVFLLEQMMCKVFPSPPPNVNEILEEALKKVDPTKLTQRQKLNNCQRDMSQAVDPWERPLSYSIPSVVSARKKANWRLIRRENCLILAMVLGRSKMRLLRILWLLCKPSQGLSGFNAVFR